MPAFQESGHEDDLWTTRPHDTRPKPKPVPVPWAPDNRLGPKQDDPIGGLAGEAAKAALGPKHDDPSDPGWASGWVG
jgi:hypothetical protein